MPNTRQHAVSPSLAVVLGGLAAGVIDITYACIFWAIKAGVRPSRIFQSVAAGLLGRQAAVAGGAPTAALGLALHFFIALTVAFVYYTAARYAEALWRRPWAFGSLYGVAVFGVMHYIVVPLSAAGGAGVRPLRPAVGRPVARRARVRDRRAGGPGRSRRAPGPCRRAAGRRVADGCARLNRRSRTCAGRAPTCRAAAPPSRRPLGESGRRRADPRPSPRASAAPARSSASRSTSPAPAARTGCAAPADP